MPVVLTAAARQVGELRTIERAAEARGLRRALEMAVNMCGQQPGDTASHYAEGLLVEDLARSVNAAIAELDGEQLTLPWAPLL